MRYLSTLNRGQDSPATVSDYEAIILLIAIEREVWQRKDIEHQSSALDAIVWVSPRGISIWRAGKSRAHIQAMGTPSGERKSNQYWSLIEVVRVSNINQYWSERRPVLVETTPPRASHYQHLNSPSHDQLHRISRERIYRPPRTDC